MKTHITWTSPVKVLVVLTIAILCFVVIAAYDKKENPQWIQLHNGDVYTVQQVVYVIEDEVNFTDDKDVIRHVKLDDIWKVSPTAAKDIANKVHNTK